MKEKNKTKHHGCRLFAGSLERHRKRGGGEHAFPDIGGKPSDARTTVLWQNVFTVQASVWDNIKLSRDFPK